MRCAWGAAVGLAILAGCGGGSTAADDADAAAAEGGTADAAQDGSAGDAGADARPDQAAEAGAPTHCASLSPAPKFCDDFDDGNLTNDWDATIVTIGGTEDLDTLTSTSAPASFVGTVGAQPLSGNVGSAGLRSTVTGTPTHVSFALSVKLSVASFASGELAIANLDLSPTRRISFYLRDDDVTPKASLKISDGAGTVYLALSKLPAVDTWTRITFDVDAAGGKLTLSYDAEKILDAVTIGAGATQDPTFRIGAIYTVGPLDPFTIHVDDVVVDF